MFGVLVWGFQDGGLADALGFTPPGALEPSFPIPMFCIAYGLSMDYEAFMPARIKEEFARTGDTADAGLALAVLVDAPLVRALLLPASMRLLGRADWWAPPLLMRLHRRIGVSH